MEKILKPKELDRFLQWPLGKAARLARQGKVPHIILPDGQIRFAQQDIEQFLQSRSKGASNE